MEFGKTWDSTLKSKDSADPLIQFFLVSDSKSPDLALRNKTRILSKLCFILTKSKYLVVSFFVCCFMLVNGHLIQFIPWHCFRGSFNNDIDSKNQWKYGDFGYQPVKKFPRRRFIQSDQTNVPKNRFLYPTWIQKDVVTDNFLDFYLNFARRLIWILTKL